MPENNYDMFKLVEEVEKQKKTASIDDIFSSLDAVKTEEVKPVVEEHPVLAQKLEDTIEENVVEKSKNENEN